MNIDVDRRALAESFKTASQAVDTRTKNEAFHYVRFLVQDEELELIGANYDFTLKTSLRCKQVMMEDTFLMPSRFGAILANADQERIVITRKNPRLLAIKSGKSEFELTIPHGDVLSQFTEIKPPSATGFYLVASDDFQKCLLRTAFATDEANSRYALGGILLEPGTVMTTVATDGRRMAKMTADAVENNPQGHQAGVIPERAIRAIQSIPKWGENARIAIDANVVAVETNGTKVISRLIDGRFPKWQDVMKQNGNAQILTVPAGVLVRLIRQVVAFSDKESKSITFKAADGWLESFCEASETGSARAQSSVEYSGPPLSVPFNARFISEALGTLDPQQTVAVHLVDRETGVLFTTEDHFAYVVMPLAEAA